MNLRNNQKRWRKWAIISISLLFLLCVSVIFGRNLYRNSSERAQKTPGLAEMTFGKTVAFAEICPEYKKFAASKREEHFPFRTQTACYLAGGTLYPHYLFVDERGYVHAKEAGVYELILTFAQSEDGSSGESYTFSVKIAVNDASYEDYIPLTEDLETWNPYGKYILTKDVSLPPELGLPIYRQPFFGVLVNPDKHTLSSPYAPSLFSENYGILDGVRVMGGSQMAEATFSAFAERNDGLIKNCFFEGGVTMAEGENDVTVLANHTGFCYGNIVRCELYTDSDVNVFGRGAEGTGDVLMWNNRVYIDVFWKRDTVNCRGKNPTIADRWSEKNDNRCFALDGTEIDVGNTYAVTLKISSASGGGYPSLEVPGGGTIDLETFSDQVLRAQPDTLAVKYWLVDGERTDSLTGYKVEKSVSIEPVVKYRKSVFQFDTIGGKKILVALQCAEEELVLPVTDGEDAVQAFGENVFDSLIESEYTVMPSKIVIPKELSAAGENIFSPTGILTLHRVGNVEVKSGNFSLMTLENDLYTADGRTLLAHFGKSNEKEYTTRGFTEKISYNAFAGENAIEIFHVESVREFFDSTFSGCLAMKEIFFGKNFRIRDEAGKASSVRELLSGLKKVREVSVDADNPDYCVKDFAVIFSDSLEYFPPSITGESKLPEGIVKIEGNVFAGCLAEKLVFPASLRNFDDSAVRDMPNLAQIEFGASHTLFINAQAYDEGTGYFAPVYYPALKTVSFRETKRIYCRGIAFANSKLETILLPATLDYDSLPLFGCAAYEIEEGSAMYRVSDGVLYRSVLNQGWDGTDYLKNKLVSYPFKKSGGTFSVPAGIDEIGEKAFYQALYLTNVRLPDNLTKIGASAFEHCLSLYSVTIGENLREIDSLAFHQCPHLHTVQLGASREGVAIGDYAFEQCTRLADFTHRDSVVSLGEWAFSNTALASFTIGDRITTLSKGCFYGSPLVEATIEKGGVTTIPTSCFAYTALEKIDLGDVTEIGIRAFEGCKSLTQIDISRIEALGERAFLYSGLESAENSLLTELADWAFYDCQALTTANFPNVSSVKYQAFGGCKNLTTFIGAPLSYVGVGAFSYVAVEEFSFAETVNALESAFSCNDALHRVNFPGNVELGESAFRYCGVLGSVEIAGNAAIGDFAFGRCTALKTLFIGGGAKIGAEAFAGCKALKNVCVTGGDVAVGGSAFSGCETLSEVRLSGDRITLGEYAFKSCTSLARVDIAASVDGCVELNVFAGISSPLYVYLKAAQAFDWKGKVPLNITFYTTAEMKKKMLESWLVKRTQIILYVFPKGEAA